MKFLTNACIKIPIRYYFSSLLSRYLSISNKISIYVTRFASSYKKLFQYTFGFISCYTKRLKEVTPVFAEETV